MTTLLSVCHREGGVRITVESDARGERGVEATVTINGPSGQTVIRNGRVRLGTVVQVIDGICARYRAPEWREGDS